MILVAGRDLFCLVLAGQSICTFAPSFCQEDQNVTAGVVVKIGKRKGVQKKQARPEEADKMGEGQHAWSPGDLVWVTVHGFPRWPGQIMDPKRAKPEVRKGQKEGKTLVSFFGDSSYGWFKPEALSAFEQNYKEGSKQSPAKLRLRKPFQAAVEEGKEVWDRRSGVEPVTDHHPLDFLAESEDDETDGSEEEEFKSAILEKVFSGKRGACPIGVGVECGRRLGVDPLGVLAVLWSGEEEGMTTALGEYWACMKELRTGSGPRRGRRKPPRRRRKSKEELEVEKAAKLEEEEKEKERSRASRRKRSSARSSGIVTPAGGARSGTRRSLRGRSGKGEAKEPSSAREVEVESNARKPGEKVGRKFVAKKLRKPRKHEGKFLFEFPPQFNDMEVEYSSQEILEGAIRLGRDPVGELYGKEDQLETQVDQKGDEEDEIWNALHIAMLRFRQKTFKRFGGRPRGSISKRITGELTPIQDFSQYPQPWGRKRVSEGTPQSWKPSKARRSTSNTNGRTSKRDYKVEPQRGEKAVLHVQFPRDRDMPSKPQLQLFLFKVSPELPLNRIICESKEHKATIILPYADVAKDASLLFMEQATRFFHIPEGTVMTGISGYVPGGTKGVSKDASEKSDKRGLPAANYVVPGNIGPTPTVDCSANPPVNPVAPIQNMGNHISPAPSAPYPGVQIPMVQGVNQYVGQGVAQVAWAMPPSHPSPAPGMVHCMATQGAPQPIINTPPSATGVPVVNTNNIIYNVTQAQPNSDAGDRPRAENMQPDQFAIEEMIAQWAAKDNQTGH